MYFQTEFFSQGILLVVETAWEAIIISLWKDSA